MESGKKSRVLFLFFLPILHIFTVTKIYVKKKEKMEKMKTIYCFVGRSNAGKDTLARMMAEEFSIPVICSYTDRPMRITEKQDVQHHFLSQKAMNRLLSTEEILAYTLIADKFGNGYRYCTTLKQFEEIAGESMIYIIDPNGLDELKKHTDEFNLVVIHVLAQEMVRRMRSISRGDLNFDKRNDDENAQFSKFESDLKNADVVVLNDGNVVSAYDLMKQNLLGQHYINAVEKAKK